MRELKRYTLPLILGVLALVGATIGILANTVWSPQQKVVATGETDQPFAMTRAGVLRLYEPHQEAAGVRVEATVPGDSLVWMAIGSEDDVNAWLQDESYDEIVGLSDLETLKLVAHEVPGEPGAEEETEEAQSGEEVEEAEESEETAENPIASDMWTAVKYGKHSVSLELTGDELDQSLLAATDGESAAPVITLSWETPRANTLALWSFVSAGALALLAVITAAVIGARRKRKGKQVRQIEAAPKPAKQIEEVVASVATDSDEAVQEPEAETIVVEAVQPDSAPADSALVTEPKSFEVETVVQAEPEVVEAEVIDAQVESQEETQVEPQEEAELQEESVFYPVAGRIGARGRQAAKVQEPPADSGSLEEVVTTESGMMNLAALQAGRGFPSRRAMRDAEKRGVEALVVDGRRYETRTGEIPMVGNASEDAQKRHSRNPFSQSATKDGKGGKGSEDEPSQGE